MRDVWKIKVKRWGAAARLYPLCGVSLARAALFPGRELKRLAGGRAGDRGLEEKVVLRCAGRWFGLAERLGWHPSCLVRSLVLAGLLRREGHDARLVFGVRGDDGKMTGHCWVSVEGRVVAGGLPGFEELQYE